MYTMRERDTSRLKASVKGNVLPKSSIFVVGTFYSPILALF